MCGYDRARGYDLVCVHECMCVVCTYVCMYVRMYVVCVCRQVRIIEFDPLSM